MTASWLEEARRLRAEGMSSTAIARQVGVGESSVRRAFARAAAAKGDKKRAADPHSMHIPAERKPRVPRQLVPREVINAAVLAFAAHRIDRAELMRLITPVHEA